MAAVHPTLRVAPLLVPWLALLVIGTIMVGSAAVALGGNYLQKHVMFTGVAVVGCAFVFAVPPAWWHRAYLLGWMASVIIAVLVLIPGLGHEANGARRWIYIGGFSVQAAEIAKFGLCVYLAGYLSRHHEKLHTDPKVLFVPLGMVGLVCGLLIAEPDLGSAVVILSAATALLFLAGAKLRYFVVILALGAVALALLVVAAPYRMQRLVGFLDPWALAFDSGYQLVQALIAFGRGELFGVGLGEGVQKLYYLPEPHNDFIFAVVAEEFGVLGAILLAALVAYLVIQIFITARRNIELKAYFAGTVAYFTGLVLGIQFLVHLGVNTGVLPTKGLTLPFVSYGGNSLIISCVLLALTFRTTFDAPLEKRGWHG